MMRENHKTQSSEYIVICQDDLYIASTTPDEIFQVLQYKYKININPDAYLEGKFPNDPGETMICQLMKYLEKSSVNAYLLFNSRLPTDLQIFFKISID